MFHKDYSNFVRPTNDSEINKPTVNFPFLSGEQAKKLYLEEVQNSASHSVFSTTNTSYIRDKGSCNRKRKNSVKLTDRELFQCVQNNDVELISVALDTSPEKINIVDEFGWNLLMIACQANSIETVKELLKRGIDTSVRDKSGNSAQSLVIKNKNYTLADILLSHKSNEDENECKTSKQIKVKLKEEYKCEICNNTTFPDKQEHLSSTVHNINASKGKKLPANYVIPQSNKGYQIMVKGGWDKETGLGPDGTGTKYPIKPVMKKDRTGLGLKPKKEGNVVKESSKVINRKIIAREQYNNRRKEINFRREFY
ncbi:G patch domain and ankyrin repeat-containing protein 1 homolog [Colias croceus]|uniref:G patch domain and ankyrin repeat-containing protein 1 homolog n=1 Tax=Colias crocea TaxID=72248 RepID=UPI001E280F15|nr:G patch domain and ankyrin repeat-containing protein 1 homolog [Colias croceus]